MTTLRAVIGAHGCTAALLDGRVSSSSVTLEFATVEGPLRNAMTLMARDAEYDLCEMSPTSYLMARLAGVPLIALAVSPYRQFPLDQIVVRSSSGISAASDLAGARIGTRTWAQPTGLWIREILALGDARWTFTASDPFAGVRRPAGSVSQPGESLTSLLTSGQVDAVIGSAEVPPGCRALFADPLLESRSWYSKTGLIPVNHLIVMRATHRDPSLLTEIIRMFSEAKRLSAPDAAVDHLRQVTGLDDPMPYGWQANAAVCTVLVEAMRRQGMIDAPVTADDVIERLLWPNLLGRWRHRTRRRSSWSLSTGRSTPT
jgi:4,5-dihydroxyphthalate decarboxylase